MGRFINRDSVALAGSVLGTVSVFFGWLTLKPNRLAAGTSFGIWDGFAWQNGSVILLLWLFCLALSLSLRGRFRVILLGLTANLILVIVFLLAGLSAGRFLEGSSPATRVSLGLGFWLTIFSTYVVIFASRRQLTGDRIWYSLVSWAGILAVILLLAGGWLSELSILREYSAREDRFLKELWQHLYLFGVAVAIGTLIAVPMAIWATRSKRIERPVFYLANIAQTVPSLALFGLLIAPLSALSFAYPALREFGIRGVGATPAIIALVIYSLLPIMRNTYIGLRQVDPAAIDAGIGMGMSRLVVFLRIEIPLAARLIIEGIRTASVQAVGLVTVAALIGAGGLGWFVFQGLGQQAEDLILLGSLPIIILALLVDTVMRLFIRLATPKGLTV